ncbi:MAG: NADAR family protein [Lachnospiraceae bacterium]
MICFHNPDEENGYLSNWFLSEFTVGGITFSSMEQYMMYEKAVLFKDQTIAEKILQTDDVAKIKALGRTVHNFDDNVWAKEREGIVYNGVLEKFRQNPELAEKLERTDEEIIAECAVKDRIWGIGLSMEDENRRCIDKWRGQNLLGKILMQVREDIRHQNRVTQAFRNVEKAFSGVAEDAGFHAESELRDYAERIRQKKE